MKRISNIHRGLLLLLLYSVVTSCDVITGIFKAGMGFGIFIVVAIIIGIAFLIFRITGNKK